MWAAWGDEQLFWLNPAGLGTAPTRWGGSWLVRIIWNVSFNNLTYIATALPQGMPVHSR